MSGSEITGLMTAAAIGGAINAVAGGGTLVTFPTLLFYGTAPTVANATSTLALVIGTSGSLFGYREHFAKVKPWLRCFVPLSILGGFLGSLLLTRTTDRTFSKLVPFLILFATMLFLAQGLLRKSSATKSHPRRDLSTPAGRLVIWGAALFQFAVAIYGGYFGAGIGILMLATLGFIGLSHIHEMNALKTVLGSLINLVAAVWFVLAGLIDWPRAGVMTLGAALGYYLGSRYSQRIPQQRVRHIITAVGLTLSLVTFYKEFVTALR